MPTEDAYSSGHLALSHFVTCMCSNVVSHFGTCMCSNVETNLSWTCLVSGLFEFRTSLGTSLLLRGICHTAVSDLFPFLFNVSVQATTRSQPFYMIIPRNLPIYSPFTTRREYGGHILDLTPGSPRGKLVKEMQVLSDSQFQYISNQNQFHACIVTCVDWYFKVM